MDQDSIRLSKFLARAGVASRRKADYIITSGQVKVNNIDVLDPFFRVAPRKDVITVNGERIKYDISFKYIALYKPMGYLSDLTDKRDRKLARALLNDEERLFPIGRLDYQSEGLMLFTNDGAFAQRVMHPRYEVEKEYLVKLKGKLDADDMRNAMEGVLVAGVSYAFDQIRLVRAEKENSWYHITIHEGKNRMIRKLAEALSHPVIRLRRVRIGSVHLGRMLPGEHRHLTQREIAFFSSQSRSLEPVEVPPKPVRLT